MALTPRLELRQSQALVMTPQLQQAIKLLQLSNIELIEYVEQELAQNPLLEQGDESYGVGDANDPGPAAFAEDAKAAKPLEELDAEYNTCWDEDGPSEGLADGHPEAFASLVLGEWKGRGGNFDGNALGLEETLPEKPPLREYLAGQMAMGLDSQQDRLIGMALIDALDEAGYISGGVDEAAKALGCPPERVEEVLSKMQAFDPPGIFARSLAECLALQLRDKNRLDPAMQAMLDNLDLLAKRDLPALVKVCGVDAEDITLMAAELRALNPKPALGYDAETARAIIPDIIMKAIPGGGWRIELNPDTLPRVLVNNSYYAYISGKASSKKDKQYINNCLQSAAWLVKSLHQRAATILKVASEIVRRQEGFFAHGVDGLRPLVLRDIAQAIDMHESTVSRVTTNKYIASPRGIYELKYFFAAAINSSSGGEAHSAKSVRHRIKELIDQEPPEKILSDDKLVELLKNEGVGIARRTVAKYREAMKIASSVQRRREKSSGF